ncbi:hypothetical protein CR51_27155 [Caballeronia megalochromosomata]|nr:hypothetical protein CR51_27155 [Caballeronia megalochromosomata]
MLRGILEAAAVLIVMGVGVYFVVTVLNGCVAQPPGTMAGHNTTLPAQPACLLFCFAEVRSSIDSPIPNGPTPDKKGKPTQPSVVVPPSVINSAPATTTPAAPPPISPRP